ncbi:DUF6221 family protein [Streptomyces sp. NPDC005892]|uniref:DUF6221 family protein n=1 Tax=Streptomyces sp. NPDC005892 TaxID=3155593 RepID=UPI0033DDFE93
MTAGLVQFLRDRLTEDEAVATQALDFAEGEWQMNEAENVALCWTMTAHGRQLTPITDGRWKHPMIDGPGLVPHIARHDPARVLREVEAKRGVVRQYEDMHNQARHPVSADNRMRARVAQGELGDVLRLLALPYADHPDYRAEWTP